MTPEHAVIIRDNLLEQFSGEIDGLQKVIRHIPDDKIGFRPADSAMTAGHQSWHCATAIRWFRVGMESGEFGEELDDSSMPRLPDDLAQAVGKMLREDGDYFKSLSGDELAATIPFFDGNAYPKLSYMQWGIWHLIHHRAQVSTYLRIAGCKVPAIYGPSGDEGFGEAAEA